MKGLKKIPKKTWDTFSEDRKRYHELEYKKSFERNKRFTILSTRIIAIALIAALFFIGFAMMKQVKEYGQIKDKYGEQAFCYLCGKETLKKCECQYQTNMYDYDDYMLSDDYALQLAEYNSQECTYSKVIGSQNNENDGIQIDFNISG